MSKKNLKETSENYVGDAVDMDATQEFPLADASKDAEVAALIHNIDLLPLWSSMPCITQNDRMKLFNYRNVWGNGIHALKQPEGILVRDVVMFNQEYTNQEGEQVSGPVCIFIDDQGKPHRIGSKLLVRQWLEFMRDFGVPPYNPCIRIRAQDLILENGNRTYQLVVGD